MARYKVDQALPSDAAAINKIDCAAEPDPFRQFMEGSGDAARKEAGMLKWWTKCLESSDQRILVARDEEDGEIVSYAQWDLPRSNAPNPTLAPQTAEEKAQLRDKREAHIQPGQNGPLLLDWWEKLDVLQAAFGTEPLYYLNALRTVPAHRGQGLASKLIQRVLDEADSKGIETGLYTDGDGKAKFLYERLGYVEAGRFDINLTDFGGNGRHLELAMVRESRGQSLDIE